jgi:hypothetical protein
MKHKLRPKAAKRPAGGAGCEGECAYRVIIHVPRCSPTQLIGEIPPADPGGACALRVCFAGRPENANLQDRLGSCGIPDAVVRPCGDGRYRPVGTRAELAGLISGAPVAHMWS